MSIIETMSSFWNNLIKDENQKVYECNSKKCKVKIVKWFDKRENDQLLSIKHKNTNIFIGLTFIANSPYIKIEQSTDDSWLVNYQKSYKTIYIEESNCFIVKNKEINILVLYFLNDKQAKIVSDFINACTNEILLNQQNIMI